MRSCRVLFVVLSALMSLGFGGVVGVSAASAVPSRFTCTGTVTPFAPELIPPGTYALLSMPAGSLCYVADASVGGGAVTVNHGLTLGEASLLPLTGGRVVLDGTVLEDPALAIVLLHRAHRVLGEDVVADVVDRHGAAV